MTQYLLIFFFFFIEHNTSQYNRDLPVSGGGVGVGVGGRYQIERNILTV